MVPTGKLLTAEVIKKYLLVPYWQQKYVSGTNWCATDSGGKLEVPTGTILAAVVIERYLLVPYWQ